jgi:hypothetical protein
MTWDGTEITTGFGVYTVWVWDSWNNDTARIPFDTEVTYVRGTPTVIQDYSFTDPFGPEIATLLFPAITGFDSSADFPWLKAYTNVDIYYLPCTVDSWTPDHGHPESQVLDPSTNSTMLYVHEFDQSGNRIKPIWEGFIQSRDPGYEGTTVSCKGAAYQLDNYYAKPINPLRPKRTEEMIARYFDPRRRGLWLKAMNLSVDSPMWDRFTRTYDQWDHDRLFAQGGIRFTPTATDDPLVGGSVPVGGDQAEIELGLPWTTWITRHTGGWEKALTGYVQGALMTMYAAPTIPPPGADPDEPTSGTDITDGDSWTIDVLPGREPVFKLKRQTDPPTHYAWYGQPGVTPRLTEDGTQAYNVIYGQGIGPDGTTWNEMRPLGDHATIAWQPIYPEEADDSLYVGWYRGNNLAENYDGYAAERDRAEGNSIVERYISDFPSGIDEQDAKRIAGMWARRDATPGWMGTIEIDTDLYDAIGTVMPKQGIRQGSVVCLMGFQGTTDVPVPGVNVFFVSKVEVSPTAGSVTVTVDTKFRDKLTVEHAMASGKDSLSTVPALRVGQMMNQIQDLAAPWAANKGAGVMPRPSHDLWTNTESFPYCVHNETTGVWSGFTTLAPGDDPRYPLGNRPRDHIKLAFRNDGAGFTGGASQVVKFIQASPDNIAEPADSLSLRNTVFGEDLTTHGLYVPVQAGAANPTGRWAFFPILLANAGSIYRTEMAAYDKNGHLAPVEFHMSLYSVKVDQSGMPADPNDSSNTFPGSKVAYAALWDGAFEKVRRNGTPWPENEKEWHWGNPHQQIGWGTFDRPGGYSPGTKDPGDMTPTGQLVDGAQWDFDMNDVLDWGGHAYDDPSSADFIPAPATAISWWAAVYVQIPGPRSASGVGDPTDATGLNWVYLRGRCYRAVSLGTSA